jgi:hypothetical protein
MQDKVEPGYTFMDSSIDWNDDAGALMYAHRNPELRLYSPLPEGPGMHLSAFHLTNATFL